MVFKSPVVLSGINLSTVLKVPLLLEYLHIILLYISLSLDVFHISSDVHTSSVLYPAVIAIVAFQIKTLQNMNRLYKMKRCY